MAFEYLFTISGLNGETAQVRATDPVAGEPAPASIVAHTGTTITVSIGLTDAPRLLVLTD